LFNDSKDLKNSLAEFTNFLISASRNSFNLVCEGRSTLYGVGGVYDDTFDAHPWIMLVEPSARPIHLLGLALVDLGSCDIVLAFALP
jgi:hypothetical protein